MQIPKPAEPDKLAFIEAVTPFPGAVVKPMFGNLGAFVNGNMFAGIFGSDLGVRLLEEGSRQQLADVPGSGPFGPTGRPMGAYLSLPRTWRENPGMVAEWLGRAFDQVSRLPSKRLSAPIGHAGITRPRTIR
jgi:TfoX/Sxy family transcriptional regulator of competence genes